MLVAAIGLVYLASLRGDFLWDDDLHITANPTIVGPLGLKEIWTSARANYFPLVLTNFRVQHALWELNPLGYRIVTLACHATAALLLWRVLLALAVPGAWLGAALWALHPVQTESVAWICELKNTQSAVFFLAAILFWLRWLESGDRRRFAALSFFCAVLAILSKPSTVMLPVALGLCVWWRETRIQRRHLLALAPFFILSAVAAGWTIWEQKFHSGAAGPEWSQTPLERAAIAGRVMWFYLGKIVWPEPLMFIYPRWTIAARDPAIYVGALGAIAALALLWLGRNGRLRPVFFAALFFVALLFPVLGFFDVYFFRYAFVGDHFQYLASMAPLALAGAALTRGLPRAAPLLAGALLFVLGILTTRQSLNFRNNEALWRHTVARNPGAVMAWLNLADTLARAERHEESIATYRQALQLRPDDPHGWNDLGCELTLVDRAAEAIPCLERALALRPDDAEAHNNLGNALRNVGRNPEALAHYRRALAVKPDYVGAMNNLGAELAEGGSVSEAADLFRAALRLAPADAAAHDNLGAAFRKLRRLTEAIAEHREALRLNPQLAQAHANLGRALVAEGRPADALTHFETALRLKPAFAAARGHYAGALATLGRTADAMAQLERAAELSPKSAEALVNLGAALAQSGRADEAIVRFEAAVRLAPQMAVARANLGTALGAASRWREAIPHLKVAVELAPDNPSSHAQFAVALVNADQLENAVPVFENALRLDPNSAGVHDHFAQLLRALGRNREAFDHFEKAADLRRAAPR